MSFVLAAPAALAAAASDIAGIGSTISAANAAAAVPTTGVLAAAADEVSAQVAALFSTHGQGYQKLSAQLAAFHDQFVAALNSGATQYAAAEASAAQNLLSAINAPAEKLLGQGAQGGIVSNAVSQIQNVVTGGPSALGLRPTGGANGLAAAAGGLLRPAAAVAAAPAGSIGAAIENAYLVIEPYVAYGFQVAAYAAGWIPYVGWIVGQQIYFFYDLIEPMVQAGLFNTIDWLSGSISFAQGWSNFWDVTTASINQFINSEFNWIFGTLLPPLPPLPPFFP
jgi:hypothetical protein